MFPMLHLEARRDLSDLGLLFDRQGRQDQRGGHSSRSLASWARPRLEAKSPVSESVRMWKKEELCLCG